MNETIANLAQNLTLKKSDVDQSFKIINTSASKLLLNEKRNIGCAENVFVPHMKKTTTHDPLIHQISSSEVEKPKYWKSGNKRGKVVKSQTEIKKRKTKGEEYSDKRKQKLANSKKK